MSVEETRNEAMEAAKKLCGMSKGQITQTVNWLKAILSNAAGEADWLLIQDLETQNLFWKLQGLSQHFEAAHEKYISGRDTKEDEAEEEVQIQADIKYYEEVSEKIFEATRL